NPLFALSAKEGHQEDELGFKGRIALQLADPVTIAFLKREKAPAGAVEGYVQRGEMRQVVPHTVCGRPHPSHCRPVCSYHGIPFPQSSRPPLAARSFTNCE